MSLESFSLEQDRALACTISSVDRGVTLGVPVGVLPFSHNFGTNPIIFTLPTRPFPRLLLPLKAKPRPLFLMPILCTVVSDSLSASLAVDI